MSKVSICDLGDLIEFQRGYDLTKSNFIDGPYPVQSSNGILGYHNEYKVKGPGITIGRSGTVGIPHLLQENFYPHNTALFVKDFKGNNVSYIYYLLRSLKLGDMKTGSGVPTMNRNHLHPLKIQAIRNIDEQCKISYVLSTIEQKIELNNKINAELEAMAKTLYDYWFVQFDFPDADGKPYKSSGGKMIYNEVLKREIPEGWDVKALDDVFIYQEGPGITKEKYSKNGHNFINIKCIQDDDLDVSNASMISEQFVEPYSHFQLDENDIVLSTSGTLGRSAIVRKAHLPLLLNTSVIRFKAKNPSYFEYLYLYLKSPTFIAYLNQLATGSIQKNFGPTHLNQMSEVFPDEPTIKAFNQKLSSVIKKIILLRTENDSFRTLRDWLLPMLMNGQVTVSQ